MGYKQYRSKEDEKRYRVIGMNKKGYTTEEIASAVSLPKWMVLYYIQIEYGRDKLYKNFKRA